MNLWILVFLFNGQPMASGPHELEVCLLMAEYATQAHCYNVKTLERRYLIKSEP